MKRFLVFIFLSGHFSSMAQLTSISLHVGSNFPLIPEARKETTINPVPVTSGYSSVFSNAGSLTESYKGSAGINLSGQLKYKLSERIFMSSGLSFQYVRYQLFIRVDDLY